MTLRTILLATASLTLAAQAQQPPVPNIAGCPVLPSDNIWNKPIDKLPLYRYSSSYIRSIGTTGNLHADFGPAPYGIPINIVDASQPMARIGFDIADESDPGPYRIANNAALEQDSDSHLIVVDSSSCVLYEAWASQYLAPLTWWAGSGATFDLGSNALRPAGWTSADAAGLPILPGLVRYDEVAAGQINHALRMTVRHTRNKYVWPARHFASKLVGSQYPAIGMRVRLKAGFDVSKYPPQAQVILNALKKYGAFIADNGSNWFLSGATDPRWDNTVLNTLKSVKGSNFEIVDETSLMIDPSSGQSR